MVSSGDFVMMLERKIDTLENLKSKLQKQDVKVDSQVRFFLKMAKEAANEEMLLRAQGKDTHAVRFRLEAACRSAINSLRNEEKLLIDEFESAKAIEEMFKEIDKVEASKR